VSDTDRIEKQIVLRAARPRVWRALSDADEFGSWFRCKLENPFRPGATVRGRITYPGYEHLKMELRIERMEPERLFSFRWHPYAVEPEVDYSAEPMTLVEFTRPRTAAARFSPSSSPASTSSRRSAATSRSV
jgi:uncharacterized protein YndB with AHSA1/START domain